MQCPICHNNSVEGDSPELHDDPVMLKRDCHCTNDKCKAQWTEVFQMTAIIDLKAGDGPDVIR